MPSCSPPIPLLTAPSKKHKAVGASAAALQTKLAEWQAVTTELCGDIAAHGEAFRTAAAGYESTDTNSAEKLDRQL